MATHSGILVWQAIVHEVAKSQTRLSNHTYTNCENVAHRTILIPIFLSLMLPHPPTHIYIFAPSPVPDEPPASFVCLLAA